MSENPIAKSYSYLPTPVTHPVNVNKEMMIKDLGIDEISKQADKEGQVLLLSLYIIVSAIMKPPVKAPARPYKVYEAGGCRDGSYAIHCCS